MQLTEIVASVNAKLNGETLSYLDLIIHLNDCIDEINAKLSAKFPSFSEFTTTAYPLIYPDYNFFPDKYIRSVVITGAASKFYRTDEEGIDSAIQYTREYNTALFLMQRDYTNSVPAEYQDYEQGFLVGEEDERIDYDRDAAGGSDLLVW